MVELLADVGHRLIAHIGGPPHNILTTERERGYRAALAEHGLPIDDRLVTYGDFTIEFGRLAGHRLLDRADRPTAIFAANDEMAIGAIVAAKGLGLRVPRDVSLVGFDDIEFAAAYDPSLTTVHQPRREMGAAAMALLADLLEGRRPEAPEIALPHEVIVRDSAGPAPVL